MPNLFPQFIEFITYGAYVGIFCGLIIIVFNFFR